MGYGSIYREGIYILGFFWNKPLTGDNPNIGQLLFKFPPPWAIPSVVDPREGPGGPAPHPLFLDQTEAWGTEKSIFWDPAPHLSQDLDPPLPLKTMNPIDNMTELLWVRWFVNLTFKSGQNLVVLPFRWNLFGRPFAL